MPEGDSIWRAARALHQVLAGRVVTAFQARDVAVAAAARRHHLLGATVEAVEAQGKHLLVRFSTGAVLHTHQGMTGSWHLYKVGSRWRQPAERAYVQLQAGDVVAVCFAAPTVELLAPGQERRHPALPKLGPDLLRPAPALDEGLARLRADPGRSLGEALLDQELVAGIGNIWKSETLHACRLDPFTPVGALDDDGLRKVIATASALLRRSVAAPRPVRHAVYGRGGQACRRCGGRIRRDPQGRPPRSTYWCPGCQVRP